MCVSRNTGIAHTGQNVGKAVNDRFRCMPNHISKIIPYVSAQTQLKCCFSLDFFNVISIDHKAEVELDLFTHTAKIKFDILHGTLL